MNAKQGINAEYMGIHTFLLFSKFCRILMDQLQYCGSCVKWVCCVLFLLLVFSTNDASCGSVVKTLPGFDGPLPFTLETGYVSVGEAELFYYFIESERNPKKDPLLLWYSGGPGCSALNGLIYEIGQLIFNTTDYDGGLPSVEYAPYAWTKQANILFVDAPVGTGFSYARAASGWATSDSLAAKQVYNFLRTWLVDHPRFLKNALFIGADSYSGISGPIVVTHVIDGNLAGTEPLLNLQGYIIGCPRTDGAINGNSQIIFAHRIALISDELFEAANESCGGDFYGATTAESQCYEDLKLITKCTKDIDEAFILQPKCTPTAARRSLEEESGDLLRSTLGIPEYWCHQEFGYSLSYIWANNKTVQEALHVREGTVPSWNRCNNSIDYTDDVSSVVDYHKNLSAFGLQALVYNGDHDMVIPNIGTLQWITMLDLTVDTAYRPWFVDGQIAGYTIKYENDAYRLTYATVKGAGHTPQEFKRRECYEMFDRFINFYPL